MKLPRRNFLHLAAGAAALPVLSRFAWAQVYPSRPVRIIVKFPAGQATDTIARLMGQSLSERLGQPFVIENRTGAGGNIGTESVVRATPDGYTLLLVSITNAMNATSRALVAPLCHGDQRIRSSQDGPGVHSLRQGQSGQDQHGIVRQRVHVFGERFKIMTGLNLVHVPYRGGYVPDLLSGQVQVVFGTISSNIQYIRGGMLRALAVATATRSDATISEGTVIMQLK